MDSKDFISRIAYISSCLEYIIHAQSSHPEWMFIQYASRFSFEIPSMPISDFQNELGLPERFMEAFTISAAFYCRASTLYLIKVAEYRLSHPFRALRKFDEGLYYEMADIISDFLYEWGKVESGVNNTYIYDMVNSVQRGQSYREVTKKLLRMYNGCAELYTKKNFVQFCQRQVQKRASEFWFGYSLTFPRGLFGENDFKLIFFNEYGKEFQSEILLHSDYKVFSDKIMFERNVRNAFSSVFPPTSYPLNYSKNGFDIFNAKKTIQ